MSTRDIKLYIGTQFPTMEIKWINDSSCTVTFLAKEEAEQAYMQFSVRPASLKVNLESVVQSDPASTTQEIQPNPEGVEQEQEPMDAENAESAADQIRKVDGRNFDSKLGWREALGFQHETKGWQNLWIRFATDLDTKKDETKGENSRYYKFAQRSNTHSKQRQSGGRYGSHPGDRQGNRNRGERDQQTTTQRIGKKAISKTDKYRSKQRQARKGGDNSDESSDLDNSKSPQNSDRPLDDGQTRAEVDINCISKSAGILKAESMQEQAGDATTQPAAVVPAIAGDDWGEQQ